MTANPTHGSAPALADALYAIISGRKTNTHCQQRLMNAQDGSSVTPGAFHDGMTSSVAISDMNVMNSEAPSSAPRIGRNESDRYSNRVSSQAALPRGPLARAAALIAAASSTRRPTAYARACAMMSL